jgi:hypothetical protein
MGMLVGLGAWQVVYLRAYFRYVFGFGLEFGIGLGCLGVGLVANFVTDLSTLFRLVASDGFLLRLHCNSFCFVVAFSDSHDRNDIKCTPCFLPGANNIFCLPSSLVFRRDCWAFEIFESNLGMGCRLGIY